MRPKLFWKSTCSTCRDARLLLRERGIATDEREYARRPLTAPEVEELLGAATDLTPFINLRHERAKAAGWKAAPPARAELVQAAVEEPNVLRRPVLRLADDVIIGFDRARYEALTPE